jgi:iron complex outermembrane receptor protein
MSKRGSSLLLLASLLGAATAVRAQSQDLADLDLETLMGMDVFVTSASKRAQVTADSAAAAYVITREDIRRSGATNLPELLRTVPGVHVARIDGRAWTVTSRGFSSRFANKLLVMVDGRSIYTSVYSGVLWEEQAVALEEIERVEVVRGPGGALWGINAVNGIINIITRKAADAAGVRFAGGAGSTEESATMSYGGNSEHVGDYRLYVDHNEVDSIGTSAAWSHTQAGLRLDREVADGSFSFQGDINEGDFGPAPPPPAVALPATAQVGNISASWQRATAAGQLDLQSYYGWVDRGTPGRWGESAFGFDAQLAAERIGAHVLTTGVGYRHLVDEMKEPWALLNTSIPRVAQDQWSVYAQDEIYLANDDVRVTIGAKLEDLEFSGLAFQPTLRAFWDVTDSQGVWVAASRAVRTPARLELSTQVEYSAVTPEGVPVSYRAFGNQDLEPEELNAYELGWRWRPLHTLSVDVALYRNEYEQLIAIASLPPSFDPGPPPQIVIASQFVNLDHTRSEGAEVVVEWAATRWLRLEAQGTWQSRGGDVEQNGISDPKRMFMLRSSLDLPFDTELDLEWRSISELPANNIDGYDSLDARVAWWPITSVELALSMDNVLDEEHHEFYDDLAARPGAKLGRSYFARFTWRPKF